MSVDIELFHSRYDRTSSDEFQEDIEAAARVIVETYDSNVVKFRSVITKQVELVRCAEVTDVVISELFDDKRIEGSQVIRLNIDTWET